MVDLLGRTKLLYTASVHSCHALSQRHRLNLVVRNEERCDAEFDVQLLNIIVSLRAQLGVQTIRGSSKSLCGWCSMVRPIATHPRSQP